MTEAHARVERSTRIDAPRDAVWAQIDTIDGVAAMMTSLREHDDLGDGLYRFTLRSYSALGHRIVPEAELKVRWHPPALVTFEPVGESTRHARAHGQLRLADADAGVTTATVAADITLFVPIPRLLAPAAVALLSHELRSGFDRFLERLEASAIGAAQQ
jgi:carbon monoxide dehydrogenase subunit G